MKDNITWYIFFFISLLKKKKIVHTLAPHHTYNQNQHNTFSSSFFPFFLSHIFFTFCLLYFSLISIFLHTLLHLSSFKFQHLSVKKVSTPLNYYFIKGERVRKIKMKNRDLGKPIENEEQQREIEVVASHWRKIGSKQSKRKGDTA